MKWEEYPKITKEDRKLINLAISNFEGGKSHASCKKMLYAAFEKEVADIVFATEVTIFYSNKELNQAKIIQRDFKLLHPDLIVYKIWNTANDNFVCNFCFSLNGQRKPINEDFSPGINIPPAHPGCRCGITISSNVFGK